jgi:hypothetical protein
MDHDRQTVDRPMVSVDLTFADVGRLRSDYDPKTKKIKRISAKSGKVVKFGHSLTPDRP